MERRSKSTCIEPDFGSFSVATMAFLRLVKMGRTAYWKRSCEQLAWTALGDANRGAFLALQSAVSN
jgi:hypothetical protein